MEYQSWKEELKEKNLSTDDSIKLNFKKNNNSDWHYDPSPIRRNVSDTSINTPKLLQEIRTYLSFDSESIPPSSSPLENGHKSSNCVPVSTKDYNTNESFSGYVNQTASYYCYNPESVSMPNAQSYVPVYIPFMIQPTTIPLYKNPSFLSNDGEVMTGTIKFFDNNQNYGFFTVDKDGSDLFVHYDDFLQCGFTKEYIQLAKNVKTQFMFKKVNYYGKYNLSSKAIEIQLMQ